MAETGAGFAEALAEAHGARATPRPTRPPTSTASTPPRRRRSSRRSPSTPRSPPPTCYREGISEVTAADVAQRRGDRLHRQAAGDRERVTGRDGRDAVAVRVHPAMIPRTHPLAAVGDAFNAVFVEAEAAGQLMFYGRGAGGEPTASAVLGDLVAVARNRLSRRARAPASRATPTCRPADGRDAHPVPREPRRRRQAGRARDGRARVRRSTTCRIATVAAGGARRRRRRWCIVTHTRAPTPRCRRPSSELRELDAVRGVASVLRVEGGDLMTGRPSAARAVAGPDRGVPRAAAGHATRRRS